MRRLLITRRGGVVECGLRQRPDRPWRHGFAAYQRDRLCWHRSLSFRLRPHAAFDRSELAIIGSRQPAAAEAARLGPGMIVVQCEVRGRPGTRRVVELAMSPAVLTGCLSWLEASPIYPIRRASLDSRPAGRRRLARRR
jgi:Protein of unknown function (DUF2550)